MGVFNYIKKRKREFAEQKRVKTQERLKDATQQLKVIKAEGQIYTENKNLTRQLRETKKAVFQAKHPIISGALETAGKKIKESKKKGKGIYSTTKNPFMPTGQSPFMQTTKKGKGKGKGPGEGIFY